MRVALLLGSIIIFSTILIIAVIYGLNYVNDPENVVGYATDKWGDQMKQGVVNCTTDKYDWDGIMTQFEYDDSIKPPKNAKFILYDFRKQKFQKLDWGDSEINRYSANKPDEISIIVVYGIKTEKVGNVHVTTNKGKTHYYDAEEDYVKIELIDIKTWKVFAYHISPSPQRATAKTPKVILAEPTNESYLFINQTLDILQNAKEDSVE